MTGQQRISESARRLDTATDRLSSAVLDLEAREFWHSVRAALVAPLQLPHRRD